MIYLENNGKISKLTTDAPLTLTHSPVKLWDMAGWSVDGLEALLNRTPYQLLIDCLPFVGGDIVKVAIVWDEKAQGVNGGTFTAGAWRQRDLNTKLDTDTIISLASNQVTILQSGKYLVRASCPAYSCGRNQSRLTKNSSLLQQGTSESYAGTVTSRSHIAWCGNLTVDDVIRLEHQCETTVATYGFGVGDSSSYGVEIYSIMELIMFT